MISDVCVVIRSVNERTEGLCKKLILEQGVPEDLVQVISEIPFSAAMKKGFEIGYRSNCEWTYCIDADVLLRPDAISAMLKIAKSKETNVCEIQGLALDKFFGGPRPAGNHFYRSRLLPELIKRIPKEGVAIRPEYYTLERMKYDGYPWYDEPIIIGLHDSEQNYRDIYRKSFVQAHKHLHLAELFLSIWRENCIFDDDMRVAMAGFSDGISHAGGVLIDVSQPYYIDPVIRLGLEEKAEIPLSAWTGDVIGHIIDSWQVPEIFDRYFPASIGPKRSISIGSRTERFLWRVERKGALKSVLYLAGALLSRAGYKIMEASD